MLWKGKSEPSDILGKSIPKLSTVLQNTVVIALFAAQDQFTISNALKFPLSLCAIKFYVGEYAIELYMNVCHGFNRLFVFLYLFPCSVIILH